MKTPRWFCTPLFFPFIFIGGAGLTLCQGGSGWISEQCLLQRAARHWHSCPGVGRSPSMEKQTAMLPVVPVGQKCRCCPGEREGSAEAVDPRGEELRRVHTTATNSSTNMYYWACSFLCTLILWLMVTPLLPGGLCKWWAHGAAQNQGRMNPSEFSQSFPPPCHKQSHSNGQLQPVARAASIALCVPWPQTLLSCYRY